MFIFKFIKNKTMNTMQELHLLSFLFLFSTNLVLSILFSVHSSTSLSTNFFLHLQFSQSKYLPISQDLSHSHSQLLGFQINPYRILLYQLILCVYTCIYLYSSVTHYCKHFHLVCTCICKFHAILYASFLQFLKLD